MRGSPYGKGGKGKNSDAHYQDTLLEDFHDAYYTKGGKKGGGKGDWGTPQWWCKNCGTHNNVSKEFCRTPGCNRHWRNNYFGYKAHYKEVD